MAKKKSKRIWIYIILAILLIAVIAGAYYKKQQKPKGVEVEFGKVERRTINETVTASGRIFPEKEIKISSDVSGEIVELYVAEGDSVIIGQVLAKIDPEAYLSAVQRGEAAVNSSKAQIAISKSQIEANIAQKEQVSIQLNNAKQILERNKQLVEQGILSQQELEQTITNVENLQANLKSSEALIRSSEQSAQSSEFNMKSTAASLKELKTNLSRTTIKAPVSGIVSSLSVEQGERVVGTIQMAGTEMMRIANLSSMEVQVDVSENDIVRVKKGDNVDIEIDAYLDTKARGTISEIANSASNISGIGASLNTDQVTNFIVKIRVDPNSYNSLIKKGQAYPLRPGMSASVEIYTSKADSVLTIPIQAVTAREKDEDSDNKKDKAEDDYREVVFVHSADTVAMKEIVTGIQDDEYIQLISGLDLDEKLVIQDDEYIQLISGLDLDEKLVIGPYSAISSKLENGTAVHVKEENDNEKGKHK